MASPLFVAFEQRLAELENYFIVRRPDYNQYTTQDFVKGLAYRLLASAALENYVEERCLEIAKSGCARLARSQPSATGRALAVWSTMQDRWTPASVMYIHEVDAVSNSTDAQTALAAYTKAVKKSHGIAARDLRNLVYPLGLRESQVPEVLLNSLDDLAEKRNPASHAYVRLQTEPELEVKVLGQILMPLRQLDVDLGTVCTTFPISHL